MATEKNFKSEKNLKFTQKSVFLKIAAQAFETRDFLNVFLRFWVFEAFFLLKFFLIKKYHS